MEDFAFLEVMEPETGVISDAITLANTNNGGGQDNLDKLKKQPNLSPKQHNANSIASKPHPISSPEKPTKPAQQPISSSGASP